MWEDAPLLPESASTIAGQVDAVWWYLVAVSAFFTTLIAVLVLVLVVRYRASAVAGPRQVEGSLPLEVTWTVIPLTIALLAFVWGAKVYVDSIRPPAGAIDIYVTGKQWMWKLQHPGGQREINELHVPVNRPVRLTMSSEDVIHDFFVPAFRVKADVLPGRWTTIWFEATKPGTYHLFCAEYCGTKHSEMIGSVHVLEQHEYERWLSGAPAGESPVVAGEKLFEALRCATCHGAAASPEARGPDLAGRFGQAVLLTDGRTVLFDETYVRESILAPRSKVVAGFEPVMPTYDGQLSEDQLVQLLAYIKSLAVQGDGAEDR